MRAIIPSISIKGFQAVLVCLSKIGDDIVVEARPDRFILSTLNITRSAFATFTFTRVFFESYHLDTTAEAIKHDSSGPYLRCTVLAKALVSACKIRGNVESKIEKLCLFMNSAEGVGENCRLTVEIIFKYGFIKIHKLLYESCPEPLQVLDSIESCSNSWSLPPAALIGFAENFSSKAEEISMKCHQEGVTFKTFLDANEGGLKASGRFGTTVVPINRSALEFYKLQEEVEITFSLKEFKAIIAFAVTLRLPLDGYFDARSRPLLLRVQVESIVSGTFALATVLNEGEAPEPSPIPSKREYEAMKGEDRGTVAQGKSTHDKGHGELDLTQPENALFLDDDSEWLGELNSLEMEETATSAKATTTNTKNNALASVNHPKQERQSSQALQQQQKQQQLYLRVAEDVRIYEDEDEPFEIEEEFLSSSRQSKRARFNFDEDD
ncbi:Rad9-domain-containing protein [Lobosporangium transversale]|uniref:Rad9-domain-containing protein n=1 Tax=Lobosporangium transversale TaxID=64571 RepID=A0A1Y2GQ44_9FUNG|nr:Rad9-domain-containing protein [Lobosporangium transversale]ORZ16044.1 Rad9-domain-containing protein [Lobosporangium transversale]|eukprot:XP_021881391.1 Rad9-domain-containing protein [Lobosporangium transversale]